MIKLIKFLLVLGISLFILFVVFVIVGCLIVGSRLEAKYREGSIE